MARQKRDDATVKIETEIARMARTMCSYRGKPTIAEYLSGILRATVTRDFEKFLKELAARGEKLNKGD